MPEKRYPNGQLEYGIWRDEERKYHREDGPAFIRYFDNGQSAREEWFVHGVTHRIDGPAVVRYFRDGEISTEEWAINGVTHRIGNPAIIQYSEDGSIDAEKWFEDGIPHRMDGPACLIRRNSWTGPSENGYDSLFMLFGSLVTQEEHADLIKMEQLDMLIRLFEKCISNNKNDNARRLILSYLEKHDPIIAQNCRVLCELG